MRGKENKHCTVFDKNKNILYSTTIYYTSFIVGTSLIAMKIIYNMLATVSHKLLHASQVARSSPEKYAFLSKSSSSRISRKILEICINIIKIHRVCLDAN